MGLAEIQIVILLYIALILTIIAIQYYNSIHNRENNSELSYNERASGAEMVTGFLVILGLIAIAIIMFFDLYKDLPVFIISLIIAFLLFYIAVCRNKNSHTELIKKLNEINTNIEKMLPPDNTQGEHAGLEEDE